MAKKWDEIGSGSYKVYEGKEDYSWVGGLIVGGIILALIFF